jgi:hypothetical protein
MRVLGIDDVGAAGERRHRIVHVRYAHEQSHRATISSA